MIKLSIVSTLYQSASNLIEFYDRLRSAASELVGDEYEIIFVNDGSPDESLQLALALAEEDNHIIIVDLSRNFGHHKAMMAGLAYSTGESIFLIDSDLEEDPAWLISFAAKMQDKLCDVVYGVQLYRKGDWFERWSGNFFWTLFNFFTGLRLKKNTVTARLMTRRYVDALLLHDERELFIAGLWHITGFDQQSEIIEKINKNRTTYTFGHKVSLFINAITSFSVTPLIGIFYIGAIIFLLAIIYSCYLLFHWLFLAKPPSGWISVIVSIWFFGGLTISFIGIIGIYLSKIFSEIKRRPNTIVRQIYGRKL